MLGPCPWPPPVTPFAERRPYALYEAMIRRVAPYTLAGILWYQGEEDELNAAGAVARSDCGMAHDME